MSVSVPDEMETVAELWQALDVPCGTSGKALLDSMLDSFWKNLK